ncbi:sporulation histidine kinase inhibitor Sda [Alkalihalophilus lindianensis]|uniref:Sporulation histidine kinase inhibitor Sda n=1 Tax=Alkalihalophilus lindianensis TaxID=1630542 RepID=A0ABU3X7U7_9BACI|nr:sporulation histidine kinase inhibitor Sda [Alkalihalophilus lindianensis]MDV2683955.1 sporulation histidine kinase inhibitor Sda [Alkalihalophilus lindianensis]
MSLKFVSDTILLEAYRKAVRYKLDADFLNILKEELTRRNLLPDEHFFK